MINHTASSKAVPKRSEEIVGRRPDSSIEVRRFYILERNFLFLKIPFSDDRDQKWSSLVQNSSIVNDTWKNSDTIAYLFNRSG